MGIAVFTTILLYLLVRTVRTPSTAIAACFCLFAIEQWGQATIPQLATLGTFTNYCIAAILCVGVGIQFVRGNVRISDYPKAGILVAVLLIYAYASSLWTSRDDLSATQWGVAIPYIASFILLAPLLIKNTNDARRAFSDLVIVGAPLAILLTMFVRWENRWIVIGSDGAVGYANPLAIAEMAGNVILVAVLCRRLAAVPLWKVTRWLAVAGCIALAVKTGSRGQVMAVLIVLVAFWPLSHSKISVSSAALSVSGSLVIGLAVLFAVQEFWSGNTRWSHEKIESDIGGRVEMATQLLGAWWNGGPFTILFGLGNGASSNPRILGSYPHILPLEIVAEEGILGAMMYLSILAAVAAKVREAFRRSRDNSANRETLITLAAMLAYAFLLSWKQGNLLGSFNFWMLCIVVAKYAKAIAHEGAQLERSQRTRPTGGAENVN